VNDAKGLICAVQSANITIDSVTFNTLYPSVLSQSVVIYSANSGSIITISNSIFQDIGFSKVPILYDYWNCLYNVSNTTFRNIQGV
jgi:hypothetical protein